MYSTIVERCFMMEASGVHRLEALTRQAVGHVPPLACPVGPHGFLKEASTCRIEAALNICFHNIAVSPTLQGVPQISSRILGTPLWAVAIAAWQEVFFEDRAQNQCYCDLQELIFERWETEGAVFAVPLRSPSS